MSYQKTLLMRKQSLQETQQLHLQLLQYKVRWVPKRKGNQKRQESIGDWSRDGIEEDRAMIQGAKLLKWK